MDNINKIELVTKEDLEAKLQYSLQQRKLPDYFLYLGITGSKNWFELEQSKEFTIASRLTELLHSNIQKIANTLPPQIDLISIGVGDGKKEKLILERLIENKSVRYFPVDISSPIVDVALETVKEFEMPITGIVAFFEDLPRFRQYWNTPTLLCMLGNNMSNYHPDNLLSTIHDVLEAGDYFLFDCHLFTAQADEEARWREIFSKSYQSEVNIRFNLSPLLERGLDKEECSFEIDLIKVDTPFGAIYRTEKHIKILKDAQIMVGKSEITFEKGDIIQMGFTYKYTAAQIEEYLRHYNFHIAHKYFSEDDVNLLILAKKV